MDNSISTTAPAPATSHPSNNRDHNHKDIQTTGYVVNEENGPFELQELLLDEVRGEEFLVEMKYSGICHTDLVARSGAFSPTLQFPAILGHEGAGYIRAIGSELVHKRPDIAVGDFVLLSFNVCGECKHCRRGHPAACLEGGKLHISSVRAEDESSPARLIKDGRAVRSMFFGQSTFAAMSIVKESCVAMKYPYPPEGAGSFAACGCGFQTGAGTVLNILEPQRDDSIAIFGLGSVGLTALMAAKHLGVHQIIAVDILDSRLQLAEELGATHTVNSKSTPDFSAAILSLTGGGGVDFAIDCVGSTAIMDGMLECLAKSGTAAVVGVPPAGKGLSIDPLKLLLRNQRLIGCLEGDSDPQSFIPQLVEMQRKGDFPLEKLCTEYDYRDLGKAIEDMCAGRVVKPVLRWS